MTTNAEALRTSPRTHEGASLADRLELAGLLAVFGVGLFVQLSIAAAQLMLAVATACWLGVVLLGRERVQVPRFFWPLAAYAGWTMVSVVFSTDPHASFGDSKQLLLFVIVPIVYRFLPAGRAPLLLTAIMFVGAASAAFGIVQWDWLRYDDLDMRPQGMLGHYMTYSGLLMLVIGITLAKLLFGKGDRLWAAIVLPALLLTVALTLSRNAWVGTFAAAALLLALKDYRLLTTLPLVAMLTITFAGSTVTARVFSMFNSQDATRLDRLAMLKEGVHMVEAHPLVGVGPDMVKRLYEQYRVEGAVEKVNPHLHNVPVQIAAERGLPALLAWLGFVTLLTYDLSIRFRRSRTPSLAAAALAAIVATLAGGMFEYNFGDSEFLMLFLLLVTLPFTVDRTDDEPLPARS